MPQEILHAMNVLNQHWVLSMAKNLEIVSTNTLRRLIVRAVMNVISGNKFANSNRSKNLKNFINPNNRNDFQDTTTVVVYGVVGATTLEIVKTKSKSVVNRGHSKNNLLYRSKLSKGEHSYDI